MGKISTVKRGIIEKGSDDIGSAVCYTIFTIYLYSAHKQLARHHPGPFSRILLYVHTGDFMKKVPQLPVCTRDR